MSVLKCPININNTLVGFAIQISGLRKPSRPTLNDSINSHIKDSEKKKKLMKIYQKKNHQILHILTGPIFIIVHAHLTSLMTSYYVGLTSQ